jgi:hypothetical protein
MSLPENETAQHYHGLVPDIKRGKCREHVMRYPVSVSVPQIDSANQPSTSHAPTAAETSKHT